MVLVTVGCRVLETVLDRPTMDSGDQEDGSVDHVAGDGGGVQDGRDASVAAEGGSACDRRVCQRRHR